MVGSHTVPSGFVLMSGMLKSSFNFYLIFKKNVLGLKACLQGTCLGLKKAAFQYVCVLIDVY